MLIERLFAGYDIVEELVQSGGLETIHGGVAKDEMPCRLAECVSSEASSLYAPSNQAPSV